MRSVELRTAVFTLGDLVPRDLVKRCFVGVAFAVPLFMLVATQAEAGRRHRAPPPEPGDVFVAEGRGCYWSRGAMTCSRFCYLEVDGRRYCQPRSDQAFPQALPYYWAQKYGGRPGHYRPRVEVAPDYRGRPWMLAPRRDVD